MAKTVLLLFISLSTSAQILSNEGNFKFLKKESAVNVEFRYDSLKVTKGFLPEKQYIDERVSRLNTRKKGEGDGWKIKWEGSRDSTWKSDFLSTLYDTYTLKRKTVFEEGLDNTTYTLIVDVNWINPGWDVYVIGEITWVDLTLTIVETADRNKILVKTTSKKAEGSIVGTKIVSNEDRISIAFMRTAKAYGKRMMQNDPLFKTSKF